MTQIEWKKNEKSDVKDHIRYVHLGELFHKFNLKKLDALPGNVAYTEIWDHLDLAKERRFPIPIVAVRLDLSTKPLVPTIPIIADRSKFLQLLRYAIETGDTERSHGLTLSSIIPVMVTTTNMELITATGTSLYTQEQIEAGEHLQKKEKPKKAPKVAATRPENFEKPVDAPVVGPITEKVAELLVKEPNIALIIDEHALKILESPIPDKYVDKTTVNGHQSPWNTTYLYLLHALSKAGVVVNLPRVPFGSANGLAGNSVGEIDSKLLVRPSLGNGDFSQNVSAIALRYMRKNVFAVVEDPNNVAALGSRVGDCRIIGLRDLFKLASAAGVLQVIGLNESIDDGNVTTNLVKQQKQPLRPATATSIMEALSGSLREAIKTPSLVEIIRKNLPSGEITTGRV